MRASRWAIESFELVSLFVLQEAEAIVRSGRGHRSQQRPLPSFPLLEETRQTQEQPFHGAVEVVHSFVVEVHLVRV